MSQLPSNFDELRIRILKHEGLNLKPYLDSVGKLTIGIGRNLTDCGISYDEAYDMLEHDLTRCEIDLVPYSWYSGLNQVRKGVLIELVFNIGLPRVLKFVNMIAALKAQDYIKASDELLNSLWAKQVGDKRANSLAKCLLTGTYY